MCTESNQYSLQIYSPLAGGHGSVASSSANRSKPDRFKLSLPVYISPLMLEFN